MKILYKKSDLNFDAKNNIASTFTNVEIYRHKMVKILQFWRENSNISNLGSLKINVDRFARVVK